MIDKAVIRQGIQVIEIMTGNRIAQTDWETLDRLAIDVAQLIFHAGHNDDYYHPLLNEMRHIRSLAADDADTTIDLG